MLPPIFEYHQRNPEQRRATLEAEEEAGFLGASCPFERRSCCKPDHAG